MPSRWDAATHGWSRRVFHYPLPTLMSRNFRLPCTIELQPLSLTPLKMRKVELSCRKLTAQMPMVFRAHLTYARVWRFRTPSVFGDITLSAIITPDSNLSTTLSATVLHCSGVAIMFDTHYDLYLTSIGEIRG